MSVVLTRPTTKEFVDYMNNDLQNLKKKSKGLAKRYAKKFLIDAGIIDKYGKTIAESNWGGYAQ